MGEVHEGVESGNPTDRDSIVGLCCREDMAEELDNHGNQLDIVNEEQLLKEMGILAVLCDEGIKRQVVGWWM